jgi:hypothetical protein
VAKPNYHHARRQKELVRKTRQQEKQQKRDAAKAAPASPADANSTLDPAGAVQPNISE